MAIATKTALRVIDDGAVHQPISLAAETSKTITSITRSGTTATLTTSASHGLSDGEIVFVDGVFPEEYNGVFAITNASGSVFDYTLLRDPGADATPGSAVVWRGTLGIELDLSTALGAKLVGVIRNGATGPTLAARVLLGQGNVTGSLNKKWHEIMIGETANLAAVQIRFGIPSTVMFASVFVYGNTAQAVDVMIEAHELTSIG